MAYLARRVPTEIVATRLVSVMTTVVATLWMANVPVIQVMLALTVSTCARVESSDWIVP